MGDDIGADDVDAMCRAAYATFRHEAVVPLVQIGHDAWIAELFHGPTLAFKDVALQLVGRMFDHVLGERGERVTSSGRRAVTPARRRSRASGSSIASTS